MYSEMSMHGSASIPIKQQSSDRIGSSTSSGPAAVGTKPSISSAFLLGTDLFDDDDDDAAAGSSSSGDGRAVAASPPLVSGSSASGGGPGRRPIGPLAALSSPSSVVALPLGDDPPELEPGGWHPQSGTAAERQRALDAFELDLGAVSPDDMR